MKLIAYGVCDIGLKKPNNEDMVLLGDAIFRDGSRMAEFDSEHTLAFAVADGVGGAEKGEIASEIVLTNLREMLSKIPDVLSNDELQEVFNVYSQETHNSIAMGGSTIVGILVYNGKLYRFHAGDSRLYLMRDGGLRRLTVDHSPRESGGNPNAPANHISNSLGGGTSAFIEFAEIKQPFKKDDIYLLASDGLTDLVPPDVISDILFTSESEIGEPHAERLLKLANEAGGKDNIAVITVKINV